MNELILTNPGGEPFTQDDLNFIQNGLAQALEGLSRGFNPSSAGYIIVGCGVSLNDDTDTYWMAPGFVALSNSDYTNEIFYVPGGDMGVNPFEPADMNWVISDVPTAPDPVVYQNLTSRNIHRTRTASLSTAFSFWPYAQTPPFGLALAAVLMSQSAWTQVAPGPGFAPGFAPQASYLQFRKDFGTLVKFSGGFYCNSFTSGAPQLVFTLPVGYRPSQSQAFYLRDDLSGNNITITIGTDGTVNVSGTGYAAQQLYVTLSAISFYTN